MTTDQETMEDPIVDEMRQNLGELLEEACAATLTFSNNIKKCKGVKTILYMKRDRAKTSIKKSVEEFCNKAMFQGQLLEQKVLQVMEKKVQNLATQQENIQGKIRAVAAKCTEIEDVLEVGKEHQMMKNGPRIAKELQSLLVEKNQDFSEFGCLEFICPDSDYKGWEPSIIGYIKHANVTPEQIQLNKADLSKAHPGEVESIRIHVQSSQVQDLTSALSVTGSCVSGTGEIHVKVHEMKDSIVTVEYIASKPGLYQLCISLFGVQVGESPYYILVEEKGRERGRISQGSKNAIFRHLAGNSPRRQVLGRELQRSNSAVFERSTDLTSSPKKSSDQNVAQLSPASVRKKTGLVSSGCRMSLQQTCFTSEKLGINSVDNPEDKLSMLIKREPVTPEKDDRDADLYRCNRGDEFEGNIKSEVEELSHKSLSTDLNKDMNCAPKLADKQPGTKPNSLQSISAEFVAKWSQAPQTNSKDTGECKVKDNQHQNVAVEKSLGGIQQKSCPNLNQKHVSRWGQPSKPGTEEGKNKELKDSDGWNTDPDETGKSESNRDAPKHCDTNTNKSAASALELALKQDKQVCGKVISDHKYQSLAEKKEDMDKEQCQKPALTTNLTTNLKRISRWDQPANLGMNASGQSSLLSQRSDSTWDKVSKVSVESKGVEGASLLTGEKKKCQNISPSTEKMTSAEVWSDPNNNTKIIKKEEQAGVSTSVKQPGEPSGVKTGEKNLQGGQTAAKSSGSLTSMRKTTASTTEKPVTVPHRACIQGKGVTSVTLGKSVIKNHMQLFHNQDIPATLVQKIGHRGSGPDGSLSFPIGVTVSQSKDVIICANGLDCVKVFRPDGTLKLIIGQAPNRVFRRPSAVVVNKDEEIFVKDDYQIQVFDSSGNFLRNFGKGLLLKPYGLAFTQEKDLLVLDHSRKSTLIFTQMGSLVREVSYEPLERPTRQSKFRFLHVYKNKLVVADLGGSHVCITDVNSGRLVAVIGEQGTTPGDFIEPSGITMDPEGCLLIADSKNNRIQVFDTEGKYMCKLVLDEVIRRPADIHLTEDNRLFIVNLLEHCVKVYKLGKPAGAT